MSNLTLQSLREKVKKAAPSLEAIPNFVDTLTVELPLPTSEEKSYGEAYIWNRLHKLGIYEDEESHSLLVNECPVGDARRVFCENGEPNLPTVRFRHMWNILVGYEPDEKENEQTQEEKPSEIKEVIKAFRPIGQWSDKELVMAYGPDCDQTISDALEKRSHGRAFVVFEDSTGKVDVEITLRMLREARRRETPINYKAGDALKRLYRAGEFPGLFYTRCPFHNDILLVDGYCDESKSSWEGIDYECMQFAKIALELGDVTLDNPSVRQFMAIARGEGLHGLQRDFQHTALVFEERKQTDDLPSLKVRFADDHDEVKKADPFGKQRF